MPNYDLKEVKTLNYQRPDIVNGYADQTLYLNLSDQKIAINPVAEKTKKTFTGGKGYNLWLLWNAVQPSTKWNDPENALCIAAGPLGGTPIYPGSGKSIVATLSPTTASVIDSNVGGYFGPYLKFSGFDALEIQGKSAKEVVVFIDGVNQKIQIYETKGLPQDAYALSAVLTEHLPRENPAISRLFQRAPGPKTP